MFPINAIFTGNLGFGFCAASSILIIVQSGKWLNDQPCIECDRTAACYTQYLRLTHSCAFKTLLPLSVKMANFLFCNMGTTYVSIVHVCIHYYPIFLVSLNRNPWSESTRVFQNTPLCHNTTPCLPGPWRILAQHSQQLNSYPAKSVNFLTWIFEDLGLSEC